MHGCNSLCSKQDIPCVSNTTNSLCSKHNEFLVFQTQQIPCAPSTTNPCVPNTTNSLCSKHNKFLVFQAQQFLVFPTEQSLCSQQNNKKSESQFWPKIIEKNLYRLLTPSSKSRTELNLSSSGVIFRARRADDAQRRVAPPKRLVVDSTSKFSKKIFKKIFFGAEK